MAPSPRTTAVRRPSAPIRPKTSLTSNPSVLLADVISYGYAVTIMWATLQFDLQFAVWQGIAIMVLFVMLRGVAHELRKDARRATLAEARRMATLRAQSPARWTVEQRDGLGRRVDTGA